MIIRKHGLPEKASYFISLFLAVLFCVSAFSACSTKVTGVRFLGSFLSADVILYLSEPVEKSVFDAIANDCEEEVERAERIFSTEIETSDVARFNSIVSGERTEVSEPSYRLILTAKDLHSRSGGAFDPSTYQLVDLWGFSARFDGSYRASRSYDRDRAEDGSLPLPDEKFLEAFKRLSDLSSVKAIEENGRFYLEKGAPSVVVDGETFDQKIDLSALAKGYLCDNLRSILSSRGIKDYYLSLGSSSIWLGERSGGDWSVELVDPNDGARKAFASVPLKNVGVSTSGTYENAYITNGKKYHHLIDGDTGSPFETDLLSVAVIGRDSVLSDGLSTALVCIGCEKALESIKDYRDLDFVLVTESGKVYSTIDLTMKNENYELIAV